MCFIAQYDQSRPTGIIPGSGERAYQRCPRPEFTFRLESADIATQIRLYQLRKEKDNEPNLSHGGPVGFTTDVYRKGELTMPRANVKATSMKSKERLALSN